MTKKGPTPKRESNRARRTRIIESETGLSQITGSNTQYAASDKMGQWVEPEPGVHHWMVIACFNISAERAAAAYVGVEQVPLDMENLVTLNTGCMKCAASFTLEEAKRTCPEVILDE